ncbi:HAMP domain-containing sensor histidine kinase [Corallincola platygyrae]|uniref:histidine kinase n=1 Tax=Corallincola platygyrae TaxID=1193278 RepID=A0ABW4XU87_9GAMM
MGIAGYIGAPLHSTQGDVFGIIVALYKDHIDNAEQVAALFELFSGRIAADIERMEHQHALEQLNVRLEELVAERTQELSDTLSRLKSSQAKLMEQEKLASLGRLVAGVAHEVNTPLGVSILANSSIQESTETRLQRLTQNELKRSELEDALQKLTDCSQLIAENLEKSAELVRSFKKVAVVQYTDEKQKISIADALHNLSLTMLATFNERGIELIVENRSHTIHITTYPARLLQVISSLLSNATIHGFPKRRAGSQVVLRVASNSEQLTVSISDNGVGMDTYTREHALEPFFKANPQLGSTGLGLSIVNNLVKSGLGGEFQLTSTPNQGTMIAIQLPLENDETPTMGE